jgi:outer membrane lipopolysaccharide assembly protein LptE/RlpB
MKYFAKLVSIVALSCCTLLLAGCGYRFTASAGNRIAPGQSIWVGFVANTSVSSTAQTVLRRALYEETHALRGLSPAGDEPSADLKLQGKLNSYSKVAISYDAVDRVKEYRLAIGVELELRHKGETSPLWKGVLNASQDYPASKDLALQRNAEEAALDAASRILARKLLTAVEQSY